MAPTVDQNPTLPEGPPATLPASFFEKQGSPSASPSASASAPETLPANFFAPKGGAQPADKSSFLPNSFGSDTRDLAVKYALPAAGAAVGSLVGPEGTALVGGAGQMASDALMKGIHGEADNETPIERVNRFAQNAVLGGASDIIPGALAEDAGSAIKGLASKFFKGSGKVNPEDLQSAIEAGLNESPKTSLTVGQQTQSPLANFLERGLAGKQKIAKEIAQTGKLQLDLDQYGSSLGGNAADRSAQAVGQQAQTTVKGNLERATAVEKLAFDKFETNHLANNQATFQRIDGYEPSQVLNPDGSPRMTPKITQFTVSGPIYTSEASSFANSIKPQIDAYMQGDVYQALPPFQKTKTARLSQAIDKLTQGTEVMGPEGKPNLIPILDWKTAKQIKTDINSAVGGAITPNLQEGGLQKIAALLDSDIDTSVGDWKNGTGAMRDLNAANAATQFKKQTFNQEITKRIFAAKDRRIPADASQFFDTAYQSPEKAQRMMNALGPENARFIKGDYYDNVLKPQIFDGEGNFTPDKAIKDLKDPNSVTNTIYSADERSGILRFLQASRAVSPDNSTLGKVALGFHNARVLLNLGTATAGTLLGASHGNALAGAGGTVAIEMAASQFAKNILLNPTMAENASRLLKVAPGTAEANMRTKLLMLGMKGAQVKLGTSVGDEARQEGTVSDGGKVKIEQ